MMHLSPLSAISPLDGRYRNKVASLAAYFSEYALIRYRLQVEVEYLIALHEREISPLARLEPSVIHSLRELYLSFSEADAKRVKALESVTNHDVKAVEYFLKERIEALGDAELSKHQEFIHFGLTSQDINNTAIPMMLREGLHEAYLPQLHILTGHLHDYADAWKEIPMLARTHGQPASPTGLGKEILVFAQRLMQQITELEELPFPGKFGGATGNFNAHYLAYPEEDWDTFADQFLDAQLGLRRSYPTTQIEHYDGLARIFDCLRRINTILIDLCQDLWLYISMEYFRQKIKEGEVGSSAMPHKVNPIDFENAEGNCSLSSAILEFLSRTLPVSRLQRDLTDSTILRNVGLAVGYAYLAQASIIRGLKKLVVNEEAIHADLNRNWAVLAEAIQTILRREGYPRPYEALKSYTRGKPALTEKDIRNFIEQLEVSEEVKQELRSLHPTNYTGTATR